MLILFKYCSDIENYESFRGFDFIIIIIIILKWYNDSINFYWSIIVNYFQLAKTFNLLVKIAYFHINFGMDKKKYKYFVILYMKPIIIYYIFFFFFYFIYKISKFKRNKKNIYLYSTGNFADEFERIIINTGTINAGVHSSKKKKKKPLVSISIFVA